MASKVWAIFGFAPHEIGLALGTVRNNKFVVALGATHFMFLGGGAFDGGRGGCLLGGLILASLGNPGTTLD